VAVPGLAESGTSGKHWDKKSVARLIKDETTVLIFHKAPCSKLIQKKTRVKKTVPTRKIHIPSDNHYYIKREGKNLFPAVQGFKEGLFTNHISGLLNHSLEVVLKRLLI
jgi:hypothetical protein